MPKRPPNPRLVFAWSGFVMVLFAVERLGFYGWAFLHRQSRLPLAAAALIFQLLFSASFLTASGRRFWGRLAEASGPKKLLAAFVSAIFSIGWLGFAHAFADFYELTIELLWLPVFWAILMLLIRRSTRSLAASVAVALVPQVLIFAEVTLLALGLFTPKRLDYPDVYGALGPGGFLRPHIDAQVVGQGGLVQWKTNGAGFRNDADFAPVPAPGRERILLGGDSFVAGYRVDQRQSIGAVLERLLGEKQPTEVLVSCLEDPQVAGQWFDGSGTRWHPNLFIYCVTVANDAPQVYMRVEKDYDRYMLPPDAFERSAPGMKQLKRYAIAFFRFSALGRRLDRVLDNWRPVAMTSQFGDTTGRVHVFDFYHGLGQFYRPPLPEVDRAFADLNAALGRMKAACAKNGIEFRVAIFPQRYQVDDVNWRATVKQYGLNPAHFDLAQPNRRIAGFCENNGIPCLDLTPALAQAAPGRKLFMPLGDMHFSAAGDELAAREIAGWLAKTEK